MLAGLFERRPVRARTSKSASAAPASNGPADQPRRCRLHDIGQVHDATPILRARSRTRATLADWYSTGRRGSRIAEGFADLHFGRCPRDARHRPPASSESGGTDPVRQHGPRQAGHIRHSSPWIRTVRSMPRRRRRLRRASSAAVRRRQPGSSFNSTSMPTPSTASPPTRSCATSP